MFRSFIISLLCLFAVSCYGQLNRTYDGFGNNMENPEWGSAQTEFVRVTSIGYDDGVSLPGGISRPNARVISNELFDQDHSISDENDLSDFVWVFGQFIDHDINFSESNEEEVLSIKIPSNDVFFIPGSYMKMYRSASSPNSGTNPEYPRQHDNAISSFIDASNVYGSDENRALWLRTFVDGKMKTSSGDLLPWNTKSGEFNSAVDKSAPEMTDDTGLASRLFVAGDVRANENPLLSSIHVLFVREHNRLCDELKDDHPLWNDELLYQRARKIVGAIIQSIIYYEWLPEIGIVLPDYQGYKVEVNPGIFNVFSAAAFRLGHSLITEGVFRIGENGDTLIHGYIGIEEAFFKPTVINLSGGIDAFLRGMAVQSQQLADCKMIDGVRNYLFGDPAQGGLDLAAINIMRGRERGLPDYNSVREAFGLSKYENIEDISNDAELISSIRFLYGNVDNIDPWVGMLAETHSENKMLGSLLTTVLEQQFIALRDGDRYYFEQDPAFDQDDIEKIRSISLKDIILRNSKILTLQDNVFKVEQENDKPSGPELTKVHLDAVAYPNPASDQLRIKFYSNQDTDILLTVLNPLGQRIKIENFTAVKGFNEILLPFGDTYPTGVYNVMLESGETFQILRILIK